MSILHTDGTPVQPQNGDLPSYVVASTTLSWDQVLSGDFPRICQPTDAAEPPQRAAFRQAVAQAATALRARYPQRTERITKAVQIVLAGDIEPGEGGQFIVGSQSDAGLHYVIDGACACKDADRPEIGGRCTHVLASEIFTAAYAQTAQALAQRDAAPNLHQTFEEVVEEGKPYLGEQTPESTTPALPAALTLSGAVMTEAPYSITVKIRKGGYAFPCTVRKQERKELLDALADLPAWFDTHGFEPAEGQQAPVADPADTAAPTLQPSCRYHGTQNMRPSKYGAGRFVCSVKLDSDGSYCNQTWPAKAKG